MVFVLVSLADVQKALKDEAIVPCFQPIVELRSGCVAGFEALARWEHPEHGLILPDNFISLAEENGMIGTLTNQILRKSFQVATELPEPLFLAVNISPIQLDNPALPRHIRDAADECGFPLRQLTVEITESALVNNLERARKIAVELKEAGCRLALDDFGTGYSSLRHLRALPFHKLKIDRSFVQSMITERESCKIVAALAGLAYSLDMIAVAEGVETEGQAEVLRRLGCEMAQGWLFGRPQPAANLPQMVAAQPRTFPTRIAAQGSSLTLCGLDALPAQRLAQLQAIYDGAPVGLCFLDKNLRYVSLNQRLADMNGAPVIDHLGKTVREMIPDFFPTIEPYLRRALKGEMIRNVVRPRFPIRDGLPMRRISSSYQPAFDEAEEVIGISVAAVDLTES
jgi:EAL domain-containing protein (putative c-di-GMP-specific phosphodiesterase class I)